MKDLFNCNPDSKIYKELQMAKLGLKVEDMSTNGLTSTNMTTTTTTTTEMPEMKNEDVELVKISSTGKPISAHVELHNSITSSSSSTSAELREQELDANIIGDENENELNDIEHQHDDPSQHLIMQRNHLAEASARGPFNPQDDGLLWTFAILAGVLIILTIIILIPILIISK